MISEFEHRGIWWIPGKDDEKLDGTLYFKPSEDLRLELTGTFIGIEDFMTFSRWEIVLGFTVTGKKVTLLNCVSAGTQLNMPGMPTSEISPKVAFIGTHFPSIDQIIFDTMLVRYSLMDEWLGVSGFQITRSQKENKTTITYQLPKPIESVINDNLSISILFNATSPLGATTEAKISQISKFQIKPSEPQNFDYYQNLNQPLQKFLTLATLKRVHPIFIEGTLAGEKIEVVYKNVFYYPDDSKIRSPFDLLFSYAHVKNRFDDFLRCWLETSELFEPVHNLYFGTIHSPKMYMEHKFLSLCQAIEAYHRRVSPGVYQSRDDFLKEIYPFLIDAIPEGTNKDYRASITARLKYLNEFSLRKRLKELLDTHKTVISKLIPKPNNIISPIVDTRNFFTHYDDELKEQSLDKEQLYLASERLKFILEVCFLFQLGFSDEEMIRLIDGTQIFNYLKRNKGN